MYKVVFKKGYFDAEFRFATIVEVNRLVQPALTHYYKGENDEELRIMITYEPAEDIDDILKEDDENAEIL